MGRTNDPVDFKQRTGTRRFSVKNIQGCAGDFAGSQRFIEVRFIHNTAAGTVDDHYAVFHLVESGFVQQSDSVLEFRNVNSDIVCSFIQFLRRYRLKSGLFDHLRSDKRIVYDDLHF